MTNDKSQSNQTMPTIPALPLNSPKEFHDSLQPKCTLEVAALIFSEMGVTVIKTEDEYKIAYLTAKIVRESQGKKSVGEAMQYVKSEIERMAAERAANRTFEDQLKEQSEPVAMVGQQLLQQDTYALANPIAKEKAADLHVAIHQLLPFWFASEEVENDERVIEAKKTTHNLLVEAVKSKKVKEAIVLTDYISPTQIRSALPTISQRKMLSAGESKE